MNESELRQIPLTALLAVTGVIFPQFFHLLGLGATFLPLFIPVMLGGFLLRWRFAVTLAIIAPMASFFLTGMPPITPPVLPLVICELIISATIISFMFVYKHLNKWLALILAILADRIFLFFVVFILAPVFGLPQLFTSVSLVLSGIPGIILQLVVLPAALSFIEIKFPQYFITG